MRLLRCAVPSNLHTTTGSRTVSSTRSWTAAWRRSEASTSFTNPNPSPSPDPNATLDRRMAQVGGFHIFHREDPRPLEAESLPVSPHISPYLPVSSRVSPYLATHPNQHSRGRVFSRTPPSSAAYAVLASLVLTRCSEDTAQHRAPAPMLGCLPRRTSTSEMQPLPISRAYLPIPPRRTSARSRRSG